MSRQVIRKFKTTRPKKLSLATQVANLAGCLTVLGNHVTALEARIAKLERASHSQGIIISDELAKLLCDLRRNLLHWAVPDGGDCAGR